MFKKSVNLAQVIDQQYPEEFKQMVIDIAERTLGRAKELTPVQTGHLRNAWNLGTIEKRGDTYYIEIYNNVEHYCGTAAVQQLQPELL